MKDHNNFENWVSPKKLNLLCYDDAIIGSFGSMYFIGFGISSVITPRLSDNIGRKKPYLASLFLQFLAYVVIFFSTNVYFTIVSYLVVGLCAGGRVAVGTTWLAELVPEKYGNICCTMINCGDSTIMIF